MTEEARQRYCRNCGAELDPDASFCASCGTQIDQSGVRLADTSAPGLSVGSGPVMLGFSGTALQALGYGLLALVLAMLIIPYGWAVSIMCGWYVRNLTFSDGRSAAFNGSGGQIWGYFILIIILGIIFTFIPIIGPFLNFFITVRIYLAVFRWFYHEIELSTGQSLEFHGSYWPFLGWLFLTSIAFYSIIGWGWACAAMLRWICRNTSLPGERLEFHGSGLGILWRGIAVAVGSIPIVTIPWLFVWYLRWLTGNFILRPAAN